MSNLHRSDGVFRTNIDNAVVGAVSAYAILVLNPDMLPMAMTRKFAAAAETLTNMRDYLFQEAYRKRMALLERPRRYRKPRKKAKR